MVSHSKSKAAKSPAQPPVAAAREMKLPVTAEILRRLYSRMVKSRMAGERVQAILRRNGNRGRGGILQGMEVAVAAATIELQPEDAVAPLRQSPSFHFAIGAPLAQVFAEMFPREGQQDASPGPDSLRVIPTESAATSQLCVAAGVALACRLQKGTNIVVALADEHSLNFGSSHEALNFAAAQKLPLVVVAESAGTTASEVTRGLEARAEAYGIPGIAVDGNDAVAVYRVTHEAINRARSGRGPSLIECRTFDPDMDPVEHMERYLDKHGWWTPEWKRQLSEEYEREIKEAVRAFAPRKR